MVSAKATLTQAFGGSHVIFLECIICAKLLMEDLNLDFTSSFKKPLSHAKAGSRDPIFGSVFLTGFVSAHRNTVSRQ